MRNIIEYVFRVAGPGAYPRRLGARGRVHPGQGANPSQGTHTHPHIHSYIHTHTTGNLGLPITCISLDRGRKPEYPRKPTKHGENMQTPCIQRRESSLAGNRTRTLKALGESELADVLKQFLPLTKSGGGSVSGSADFSVDQLLLLLVYVYSLAQETQASGTQDEEKVEREIIGALTLLLTQQTTLSPLVQGFTGVSSPEELTSERAHTAVESVFETLRGLGRARDHLKQLRSVYRASDGAHQATYRPFVKQVLEEIFNPSRPECPDIEHASGGLTDLLKTGFSMFMKVNRPHPSDHPLLILFMVGGVTASELRLIREVVATHKAGTQVLVISTRLLRPADIPHLLFSTDRLSPDIGV